VSGDYETYEWYDTPYGEFRVEQKRFGTWSSYGKDDTPFITALTKEVCISGTRFHLEGVATNWENCRNSKPFDGIVGGKL
tara:strand:- start:218 stop:457 length:240 start_codon:yes stop_codon:yes gene_type:complete